MNLIIIILTEIGLRGIIFFCKCTSHILDTLYFITRQLSKLARIKYKEKSVGDAYLYLEVKLHKPLCNMTREFLIPNFISLRPNSILTIFIFRQNHYVLC